MDTHTPSPPSSRLSDVPLWRLLVALDDAERTTGPKSVTTRTLARAILRRLRQGRVPATKKGVDHAG